MGIRYSTFVLIAALGLSLMAAVPARADVRVGVHIGPPAERVVVAPAARPGYVWAPGYWRWNGRRHVWVDGRWLRTRHGRVWVADRWDQRGPDWVFVRGHWQREH